MKIISSRDNPFFRQLRKLATSARERRKNGQALLDGVHLVETCLDAGILPESLLVSAGAMERNEVGGLLRRFSPEKTVVLDDRLFAELSTVESATGVLALIAIPRPVKSAAPDFCVLLEDIQDPGNLGSILRAAAAAGATHAYLSAACTDAWSPKALRAGMGAHFSLVLHENADLFDLARTFSGTVVATAPKAEKTLYQCDLRAATAFIIGNEGAGISPDLAALACEVVRIPLASGQESLNAASAAAVCLFERVRQRLFEREH